MQCYTTWIGGNGRTLDLVIRGIPWFGDVVIEVIHRLPLHEKVLKF